MQSQSNPKIGKPVSHCLAANVWRGTGEFESPQTMNWHVKYPPKSKMASWKIIIFNRRYILKWLVFQLVMLLFRGGFYFVPLASWIVANPRYAFHGIHSKSLTLANGVFTTLSASSTGDSFFGEALFWGKPLDSWQLGNLPKNLRFFSSYKCVRIQNI